MANLGDIIDGKYEILREVGKGGMSVVYLAMDRRLNKQWAIKEFRKDKDDASKQVALKALLDEANLMKKLDHPTLPRIVDIIDENQSVYVIMDYIEGESLNKVLDAYGAQPQEAVIEWAKQLSDVLDYLHTQNPPVIYRDMKPANIMLKPDGTVRLIDFGIAREYKEGKAGDTEAIGTRGYAAPEQFGGRGQTDARTDIYSLGVTLYHLVTGKNPAEPPYEIYPIRHWDESLSTGLEWLIQKCTQLNPADRFQSCAEVSYVLEHIAEFDYDVIKKKKRRLTLFIISLVLTVVFALSSVGAFIGSSSAKKNSYDSLVDAGDYIGAIAVDSQRPEAYVSLAGEIEKSASAITDGSATGAAELGSTITKGDLLSWFPDGVMTSFREEYPKEYAEIEFRLGYAMWEKYDGVDQDGIRYAMPYFEKVINVAESGAVDKNAGLTEKQFNLAKAFYAISFFQINRSVLEENAAGDKKELSKTEEYAGIDLEAYGVSPYLAFWNTNVNLLGLMTGDAEITSAVRLETIKKLVHILNENVQSFKAANVTADQMRSFVEKLGDALDAVPDVDDGAAAAEKEDIKATVNGTVVPALNSLYGLTGDDGIGGIG